MKPYIAISCLGDMLLDIDQSDSVLSLVLGYLVTSCQSREIWLKENDVFWTGLKTEISKQKYVEPQIKINITINIRLYSWHVLMRNELFGLCVTQCSVFMCDIFPRFSA